MVKDLPCNFAEEQLAEMRDRYRNAEKDSANLAGRQALAKEQIAKEIAIEKERLAKEAKAAKKAEKKAEKRRRREKAADELSVDLRKNLGKWQEKKHAKEKTVWPIKPLLRVFSVNGEKMSTDQKTLTIRGILKRAASVEATCVDADLIEDYDLMRVNGTKDGFSYSDLERTLRIRDGDEFLALYRGKTPVA